MPIVEVKQGKLEGVECEYEDYKFSAFKGIPYAAPPVGPLRFQAPLPPNSWSGVRDASSHGPVCPQYNERLDRIEEGSEDCLYLNVYSRNLTPAAPLPVMVWIHGGGFYTGSGNSDFYGPEFFMAHDVVLVTFNYRLETFGFLCLHNEEAPGNAGLKDQVAALKWVKDNIASFGGDPVNITIFGCSAGAASVSYHMVSKQSQGLFHKAICQSGVCINDWAYNLYSRERAYQLGELLGISTDNDEELLKYLRSVPAAKLIKLQLPMVYSAKLDVVDAMQFTPVIEKPNQTNDNFITESPVTQVKSGDVAQVPLMVGYTSAEGIEIGKDLHKFVDIINLIGSVVPRELKFTLLPEKVVAIDAEIREKYFKNKPISIESMEEVVTFETFRMMAYNILRFARYHAVNSEKPVYVYKFTAETERNYGKIDYKMNHIKGVCHADDLFYLFNVTNLNVPLTEESKNIVKQIVQLWYNFALTGNPTISGFENQWKPFSDNQRNFYIIGDKFECVENVDQEHFSFWENIYKEATLVTGAQI